jgi:ectoine hydroxylase-related dioxygenase (phytanoyl-CoA dioxygenase family)
LVSESWLGPAFQLTAQVNIVHPTGAAQSPHRDYHLGFLSDDEAARYPAHVHRLSQALTLQGAVVHTAMPIEAGPTMLLPGSQRFLAGYLAWRDDRFKEHFAANQVQLALEPGDAVFFNPGLHHGAGENRTTDIDRMGNLLQISSAFGVRMEAVDWPGIAIATYPRSPTTILRCAHRDTRGQATSTPTRLRPVLLRRVCRQSCAKHSLAAQRPRTSPMPWLH